MTKEQKEKLREAICLIHRAFILLEMEGLGTPIYRNYKSITKILEKEILKDQP